MLIVFVSGMIVGAGSALLFVRSRAGLSHHPDEFSSPADIAVALDALIDFLARLARTHSS